MPREFEPGDCRFYYLFAGCFVLFGHLGHLVILVSLVTPQTVPNKENILHSSLLQNKKYFGFDSGKPYIHYIAKSSRIYK